MLTATRRPANRRGIGMPTVLRHRVPRGLQSYTMVVGRYGYDLLRNNLRPTLAFASNMGTVTPAGWAFPLGNFGGWRQTTATSPAGQTSHTIEAVVYIGQGTLAGKTAAVAFRTSGWFGIDISGSVFRAYAYDGATRTITGTTALAAGNIYVVHAVIHNRVMRLYVNGVEEGTSYTLATEPTWTTGFEIGGAYDQATAVNVLAGGFATYAAWSVGECLSRARDPWSFLRWPGDMEPGRWSAAMLGALPPVTGAGSLDLAPVLLAGFAGLATHGAGSAPLAPTEIAAAATAPAAGVGAASLAPASLVATSEVAATGAAAVLFGGLGLLADAGLAARGSGAIAIGDIAMLGGGIPAAADEGWQVDLAAETNMALSLAAEGAVSADLPADGGLSVALAAEAAFEFPGQG